MRATAGNSCQCWRQLVTAAMLPTYQTKSTKPNLPNQNFWGLALPSSWVLIPKHFKEPGKVGCRGEPLPPSLLCSQRCLNLEPEIGGGQCSSSELQCYVLWIFFSTTFFNQCGLWSYYKWILNANFSLFDPFFKEIFGDFPLRGNGG